MPYVPLSPLRWFPTKSFWICVALTALLVLPIGCGDDDKSTDAGIVVSVEPATGSVQTGGTLQFSATVTGTANQAVTWSLEEGAGSGAIDTTGLYTAPASVPSPATVTVVATSVVDPSKSGTAVVTVAESITVNVQPPTASVAVGGTQQFTATVTGTADTTVTWSVDGGEGFGTISSLGLYAPPTVLPVPASATVRVTSVTDITKFGMATVTMVPAGPVPIDFVRIPAGDFTMGDPAHEAYYAHQHAVTLTRDFYLGQTEVTNQQYMEILQWAYDHGYVTVDASGVKDNLDGSNVDLVDFDPNTCEIGFGGGVFVLRSAGEGINPDHPMKAVTWCGAAAYCDWLSVMQGLPRAYNHAIWFAPSGGYEPYGHVGYRLPTEAEWEYAAQYDDERLYPWGNEDPHQGTGPCRANSSSLCSPGWTRRVASLAAEKVIGGDSLYDMAGNVLEWCFDGWSIDLGHFPRTDPSYPAQFDRVQRGSSWSHDSSPDDLACAARYWYAPANYSYSFVGFRVARTVTP